MAIALLALAWPKANAPMLLWNASPSIPVGLYLATSEKPARGSLAIIRLPERVSQLAGRRGYLPSSALLIKPVVASAGDTVCRHGLRVLIHGSWRATARLRDGRGRILPHWRGCVRLTASQIFVLTTTVNNSFDSRYIGPIDGDAVRGTAVAAWTR
jgi:conjugative transfer signal peptidase TraF